MIDSIKIRNYTKNDFPNIEYLQPEGWENVSLYFEFFRKADFCFPVVAEYKNKIIGLANCLLNQDSGWISHIIVANEFRNQGLGYKLTSHVMDILNQKKCRTQLLIATKMGENLYLKLGFKKSNLYHFYEGKQLAAALNPKIEKISNNYVKQILEIDHYISGEYREKMISRFFSTGFVYKNKTVITGYFLPDLGDGVIIAIKDSAGFDLLKFKHSKKPCKTVLPAENKSGNQFLSENGFELFNKAYRMVLGPELDWKPEKVFCRIGGFYA